MANMMVHTNNGYELTNIKVYELSALDNITELQAIIDFVIAGNFAIVSYNGSMFLYKYKQEDIPDMGVDSYYFYQTDSIPAVTSDGAHRVCEPYLEVKVNNSGDNVIGAQRKLSTIAYYLDTRDPTHFVFNPTEDNHPANKKYVDDAATLLNGSISNLQDQFDHFVQGGTTLPLSSVTDLEGGQAILDFVYEQNGVAFVLYNDKYYTMNKKTPTTITFSNMDFDTNGFYVNTLTITFNSDHECQSIATSHKNIMTVTALPGTIDNDTLYLVKGS